MKSPLKRMLLGISVILALLFSAIGVSPAYASTLTVTNTNDSGAGSLRQTIADAAPGDTILFDATLAGQVIYLGSSLAPNKDITIDGSMLNAPITISGDSDKDGDGNVRIFFFTSGVTTTLNGLIIATGSRGIFNAGTLIITNSTISGNHSNSYGGGIENLPSATLTLTNSTVSGNSAVDGGGGIENAGTITIMNSVIAHNSGGDSGGAGIDSTGTLQITDSTVSDNSSEGQGGGIYQSGNPITITNSTISGNSGSVGGGLYKTSGTATITNSTISNNFAGNSGGGVYNQSGGMTVTSSTFLMNTVTNVGGALLNGSTLTVANSTFSGNNSTAGAALYNTNTATINNSTFSGNVGDTIYNYGGTLNYANTIIANSSAADCVNQGGGTVGIHTNNLVEDGSCSATLSGDPGLDTLADNGGPTQTMALLPGSSAIDVGDNPSCAAAPVSNLDQRGVTRPVGAHCDLGAVEYVTTYVVTDAGDPGDGTCDASCSLRDAITAANADANGDTILFNGDYTITLGASLPSPTDDLTIDGGGHTVILDGANTYNIMDATASLHLKNLTIQHATNINGGAITIHNPSTITNVTFANNAATSYGGAVDNYLTTLSITNSTFTGNTAGSGGGAIKNQGGTLTISNSTFSANSAGTGGAILVLSGTTTVYNSTFSGNLASTQAGGIYNGGTLNYANTIIANSTAGDCFNSGTLGINLNNLVEDASCSATLNGDPNLGTLANNGGSTQTFALLAHSTAINAGNDAVCAVSPVSGVDQRSTPRPNGPRCDIGAVEYVDTTAPSMTAFTATSPSTSLTVPITAFTASDDVQVTGYKITESSTPPAASDSGWTASAPTTYTVSSDGSYSLYPWAKDGVDHVSAVYGSPASVVVDTTAPTVSAIALVTTSPSAKVSVQFLVTFSESVTGISMADFSLSATVIGASITGVSGSGNTRTVTVNTGSGNGTLRLDIPNTATITDLAGNTLTSGLPFTGGQVYTINKTLTYTSTGSQDGWILESTETSNTGGALNIAAATFLLGDAAADKQYRSILSFNTTTLPDNATITQVTLKIKRPSAGFQTGNDNPFTWGQGLKVDVCKLLFGTTSALQLSDFNYNNTTNCKLLAATFGSTPSANWYSANLLSSAFAKVNKTGLTQFRLRFAKDDNDDGQADTLSFYSGNATAASRPQLVITYSVP